MDDIVEIRELKLDDYKQLIETMEAAYKNWLGSLWSFITIDRLIKKFPEGQLVICFNNKIVGCALSIIVNYDDFGDNHTYKDITGNYTFSTHNRKGNVLYGIEVFIHPDYRGKRLGRRLYDVRKELCEKYNLKAVIFGGRIPNYHKYESEMKPKEYIAKVKRKEIYDPVLTFQLSNDFHVKKVLTNYMPEDAQSREYATLLQWDNVYYDDNQSETKRITRNVRLGLIQWEMRYYTSLEQLFTQAEYFIDSVSAYKSDFAVFPNSLMRQ